MCIIEGLQQAEYWANSNQRKSVIEEELEENPGTPQKIILGILTEDFDMKSVADQCDPLFLAQVHVKFLVNVVQDLLEVII